MCLEELANKKWIALTENLSVLDDKDRTLWCGGFQHGYLENKDKQFTLEDVQKAIEMARKCEYGYDVRKDETYCDFNHTKEEIINSLKQL